MSHLQQQRGKAEQREAGDAGKLGLRGVRLAALQHQRRRLPMFLLLRLRQMLHLFGLLFGLSA